MDWLDPAYNLVDYNERRLRDELETANFVLKLIDGQGERTYANTCWHRTFGRVDQQQPIEPILADYFRHRAAGSASAPSTWRTSIFRTWARSMLTNTPSPACGAQVEALAQSGGWIIYTMHGVGLGTHNLFIDAAEHRQFAEWLGQNQALVWTAPMIDVVRHLKSSFSFNLVLMRRFAPHQYQYAKIFLLPNTSRFSDRIYTHCMLARIKQIPVVPSLPVPKLHKKANFGVWLTSGHL